MKALKLFKPIFFFPFFMYINVDLVHSRQEEELGILLLLYLDLGFWREKRNGYGKTLKKLLSSNCTIIRRILFTCLCFIFLTRVQSRILQFFFRFMLSIFIFVMIACTWLFL